MKNSIIKHMGITILAALFVASLSSCTPNNSANPETKVATEPPKKPAQMQQIFNEDWDSKVLGEFDTTVALNDKEYHITSKALNYKEDTTSLNYEITINDAKVAYNSGEYYHIEEAYLADIDPDDDSVILFVSPIWQNDLTNMTAYKYSPSSGISQLTFDLDGDGVTESTLELGRTCVDFKVREDGTFEIIMETNSRGMWGIKRYFHLDENDVLLFEQQDKYEIKGWADGSDTLQVYDNNDSEPRTITYEETRTTYTTYCIDSEEEYQMLLQGYYHCEQSYGDLQEGDYFRIVYDDNKGHAMFVTKDGREGWIDVNALSTDDETRGRIGGHALMMAS